MNSLSIRNISQKDFASNIGIKEGTLSSWKERTEPSLSDILKISNGLDVRPEWLTFGDSYEPMDDEELELVQDWRKLTAPERHAFSATIHTVVIARSEKLKKPGQRTRKPKETTSRINMVIDRELNLTAFSAQESAAPYHGSPHQFVEPQKKLRRFNRRHELDTYYLNTHGRPEKQLTGFEGLAAGPGRELQRSTDIYYIRDLNRAAGHSYARVASDSMSDTILVGDLILLQEVPYEIKLNAIGDNDPRIPINRIRSEVPNDTIWVVSLNDDAPMLKRIRYETSAGDRDWKMMIEADNPDAWPSYPVRPTDSVQFYARLKGLASIER